MTVNFDEKRLADRIKQAAMRAVVRGTESIRNEAISLVQNPPKTGRVYQRRGVEHQASAPGEAPASDTGRLVNSITTSYDTQNLVGTVNAGTKYAAYLEYGTAKMEPRPFMRPAVANKQQGIQEDIAAEIKKVSGP